MTNTTTDLWKWLGPEGAPVRGICVPPEPAETILIGTEGYGVFRSGNGGDTWLPVNEGLGDLNVYALAMDTSSPATLYAGTHLGVYITIDSGGSWQPAGLTGEAVFALAINPQNPAVLYAGTGASGISKSANGGANWEAASNGLPDAAVTTVTIDPLVSSQVWAGTWGKGIYASSDGGGGWSALNTGLGDMEVFCLAQAGLSLYAGTYFGGVRRYADGSWQPLNTGISQPYIQCLHIDPAQPDRLYAGSDNGLFVSANRGASWYGIFFPDRSVLAVTTQPGDPTRLYVCTNNGVYTTIPASYEFFLPLIEG